MRFDQISGVVRAGSGCRLRNDREKFEARVTIEAAATRGLPRN
jgi:hypothetical protein